MKKNNKDSKNSKEVENNKEEQNPKPKDKEQESSNIDDQDIKNKDAEDKLNDDQSSENNDENIALREEKIRILAEMENLRKRFEKEKIETIKYGSMNLARDILSSGDNLERALAALPQDEQHSESISNLIDGLKMVHKEFSNILEKNGVKKIEAINKKFDHNLHQAMLEVENDDIDEGIVVQEIQSGYTMYERLLRPAMVGVSKKKVKNDNSDLKNEDINKVKEDQKIGQNKEKTND